jgi:hypothetical protein
MKKQHEEEENLLFGRHEAIDRVRPNTTKLSAYPRNCQIRMCKSKMKEPVRRAGQSSLAKYFK